MNENAFVLLVRFGTIVLSQYHVAASAVFVQGDDSLAGLTVKAIGRNGLTRSGHVGHAPGVSRKTSAESLGSCRTPDHRKVSVNASADGTSNNYLSETLLEIA